MLTEGIIIALITGACAVISNLFITRANRESVAADRAKKDERTDQRLQRVEEKLDIHNGYAEKLEDVQQQLAKMSTDIAVIRTELEALKKEKNHD